MKVAGLDAPRDICWPRVPCAPAPVKELLWGSCRSRWASGANSRWIDGPRKCNSVHVFFGLGTRLR